MCYRRCENGYISKAYSNYPASRKSQNQIKGEQNKKRNIITNNQSTIETLIALYFTGIDTTPMGPRLREISAHKAKAYRASG